MLKSCALAKQMSSCAAALLLLRAAPLLLVPGVATSLTACVLCTVLCAGLRLQCNGRTAIKTASILI